MADIIRSNAANDRLRLRILQCGIQVVRSVRVDVFRPTRPNSIGVMAGMADIIRSNLTKRLFPGILSLERSRSRSSGRFGLVELRGSSCERRLVEPCELLARSLDLVQV